MRAGRRTPLYLLLALAGHSLAAQDPFAPLAAETRPLATRWQADYSGHIELGLAGVSDDSFMFGQYNGLQDEGGSLIANLDWRQWQGEQFWRVEGQDLGLDTRSGLVEWRNGSHYRVRFEVDNQRQYGNDSGRTPFTGNTKLGLPVNWQTGITTSNFGTLDESLRGVDQDLERNRYGLEFEGELAAGWNIVTSVSVEDKQGTGDVGAGIYINAASADAAQLPLDIDQRTTEFDLNLGFQGDRLVINGSYYYADFENDNDALEWQNPYYSFYDERVDYPNGYGALALAPDNEYQQLRLAATYQLAARWRVSLDGSYGRVEQEDDFLDYSVNDSLQVNEPLPRTDLGGEVDTGMIAVKLAGRPLAKLSVEASFRAEERDNNGPRDGYLYIRGDGEDQPGSLDTVYNTTHDTLKQVYGFKASYRLPWRSKLSFEYQYEDYERENAAVEQTEEDRYQLSYRIQPWQQLAARIELSYADKAADTYYWDQSYYALLDAELINRTPDSQRYINHPLLSQYHLSNQERMDAKLDLSYTPSADWQLAFNWQWQDVDYDESFLGLTSRSQQRYHLSGSYFPTDRLSFTSYASYDNFEGEQSGRAFRGGAEKNAFVETPPLPQASDPARDWDVDSEDEVIVVGFNLNWQAREDIELSADYSFVDTNGEDQLASNGGIGIDATPLPDRESTEHRLQLSGRYHMRENLSLKLEYLYFDYEQDSWAIDGVGTATIDKVLGFGQQSPDEDIHYIGASVVYRWQ